MWILKEKRSKKEKVIIVVDLIKDVKTKLKAVAVVRNLTTSYTYLNTHDFADTAHAIFSTFARHTKP